MTTAAPPRGGLSRLIQDDWSVSSSLDVAPHLIDSRGAYKVIDGLLANDGSIFKRGGSVSVSDAAFGTALRGVWDGYLTGGRRTVIASQADFGVIDSDGESPLNLGGAGYTLPKRMHELAGMLVFGDGTLYAGSRKTANYSTGTVTVTNGSKVVTGAGTAFTANVDPGMLLRVAGTGRVYAVASVDSDTQLTLRDNYEAANAAGQAYALTPIFAVASPYRSADVYAVAGNRMLACDGNQVWVSEPLNPHTYTETIQPSGNVVNNVHTLDGGVQILGAEAIGPDRALIFHTEGITSIANLAFTIVDNYGTPQRRIDTVSREIILWGDAGIAAFGTELVVPAQDDIYLIDGESEPTPISASIRAAYREHVRIGRVPGVASVYRHHYFLPILDIAGEPVEVLCCRLDRPIKSRGETIWPWSFLTPTLTSFAVRPVAGAGDEPSLLAGANDAMLVDCSGFFDPSSGNAYDHDEVAWPQLEVVTRDYETGDMNINRVRKASLIYELEEADEDDDPTISLEVGVGARNPAAPRWGQVLWSQFTWAGADEAEFDLIEEPSGPAPVNTLADQGLAQNAWTWRIAKRARWVRFRLQLSEPAAKLVIRVLEIGVAPSGGARKQKVI
jgi:hypothetical protein